MRIAALAALLLATTGAPAAEPSRRAAGAPSLAVDDEPWDFGEVYQGTVVEHVFTLTNRDSTAIKILRVEPDPGTHPALPAIVPPGGSFRLPVRHDVGLALGRHARTFAVLTDDPIRSRRKLRLTGFVESAYDPERNPLDFGQVERASGKALEVPLASRETPALRVLGTSGAPAWMEVAAREAASGTWRVRLAIRPGAPAGLQMGVVRVRTNVSAQPEWAVPWQAQVFGDVFPEENPVWFGALTIGEPAERVVRLRSRSGRAFRVASVENPWPPLQVETRACGEPACVALALRLVPAPQMAVDGLLRIRIEDRGEVVPIVYRGVVLMPGTSKGQAEFIEPVPSEPKAPSARAPAAAAPSAPPPVSSDPATATLAWTSAHEEHLYGYLVYRAGSRDGPFLRVNRAIVRPSPGGGETPSYVFVDREVLPGHTYYYMLETVDLEGRKRPFSGVVAKTIPAR